MTPASERPHEHFDGRPHRSARARADAGFLMAETLITFALSALVLLGMVSAAAVLVRATDRSVAMVGSADDLARSLAALRRDFGALSRARWSGEEPQFFVFRGGPNSLAFAEDVAAPDGGRARRAVSLREVEQGGGTALMRAEAALPAGAAGWSELRYGRPSPLPTGPARLRFRYLAEPSPDAPVPKPVDSWASGPTLPAAVLVEAVDAASRRLLVTERIAIRADGDIGCADRTRKAAAGAAAQPAGGLAPQSGVAQLGNAAAQPLRPLAGGADFSLESHEDTANPNEFCGRVDRGIAAVAGVAGVAPGPALAGAPR